ncbi:MAG TPA: DEAD/DEAH box helicase [Actinomycetes bacterium]|nr:DEAD/DEAH box helicase [Actinomycetes bacterium]
MADPDALLERLASADARRSRLTHVEHLPERQGLTSNWPSWLHQDVRHAIEQQGIAAPWAHQVEFADLAHKGQSAVISTGTASGKSLAYVMPSLHAVLASRDEGEPLGATVLYISPTKALANDQRRRLAALPVDGLRVSTYDGDTPNEEREWIRSYANVVLTNPDMLHHSMLPGHARWASFLRRLQFVVVDELHHYRGLFGAHVALVLRRLRRISARYGSNPTFLAASATASDPDQTAQRLTGVPCAAVTDDHSPRGRTVFALWEPPFSEMHGEHDAPLRRTATAEVASLLADLVIQDARTIAFVRSRRGAEVVSLLARHALAEVEPELSRTVAAYRAGFLPEERRLLEQRLTSGDLRGVAATNALELGIDVSGLDAVMLAGWPGTRASMWQQAGRAGRAGEGALVVLVARDDPLDTYLVHHPEAIFGQPVEATVFDPENPYVLGPHLAAAAAELPLTEEDLPLFGSASGALIESLVDRGWLRRRETGWFWTKRERASDLADLRGVGGHPVRVVETTTGRVLGTVDPGSAHTTVHEGAVYVHQGDSFVVRSLDLSESIALVDPAQPDYTTSARELTEISVLETEARSRLGAAELCFGSVEVTRVVVSFLRRRIATGEVLGEDPLDLPPRSLKTRAVWWTLPDAAVSVAEVSSADLPGALHAAEHASIGLLPLFATCDRWDIGGVSMAMHPDTGRPSVFVYDGAMGGAGFAEHGYHHAAAWLRATYEAISRCECLDGCPSCIQSPKCGNGNEPLDKAGALQLLSLLID